MNELEEHRKKLDSIDCQIIELLKVRNGIIENLNLFKQENKIPVFLPDQFEKNLIYRKQYAKKFNIPEKFVEELYILLHKWSVKKQNKEV